jgi:hypothetical protein
MRDRLHDFLCMIGWHTHEYRANSVVDHIRGTGMTREQIRCKNTRCRHHRWITINVERRRLW